MRLGLGITGLTCAVALGCGTPNSGVGEGVGAAGGQAGSPSAGSAGAAAGVAGAAAAGASSLGGMTTSAGAPASDAAGSGGQSGGGGQLGLGGGGAASGGDSGTAGAAGACGASGAGGDSGIRPGWTLVWRDEFDGPAGSAPDPIKWTPRVEKASANEELEYYTARPENVALDGKGFLAITARKEAYMGASYTSARLESAKKFEQAYGRFESRLKIARGQGIWPAFWIMGNNGDVGWPARGEIDIMENRGREPTISIGALHGPGYSGSKDFRGEHVIAEGVWQNFHVFAVEWEENVVRWYVDDELFQTRTPQDLVDRGGNLKWVYDHPFYVIMNVAVGGLFPGNPDATTPFPQALVADYVRVYKR